MEHTDIPAGEIHTPYQWVVDDATARLALVPIASDVDKLCLQKSDNTQWRLASIEPSVWVAVGGTVKADVTQTFSAVQKSTVTPSSASLTVDIGAVMDGIIQPEAGGALTFTGIAAGIGFELLFINTTSFAITNGGNIKAPSTLFQTLSNTGRYRLTGKCFDGVNVDLDVSAAHV